MTSPDDIAARQARQLRELAELGMALARNLQQQMLTAMTSEMESLAVEFECVARDVRETVLLQAALERRRRQALRLAQERVPPPRRLIPEPESRTRH